MLRRRLEEIQKRIGQATLVAVSKGQPLEKIREAFEAGQRDFGENYAQELEDHQRELPFAKEIRWHFIGHLQRNKVKAVLPHVALIHSVDSLALAREIDKRAGNRVVPILIEVNLEKEASKTGIPPEQVEDLVRALNSLDHIDLRGLMAMPRRPVFRELRKIRDAINRQNLYKHPLTELSMGMSDDFETAVAEGATMVRVGTGIFGEREKK